MMKTENYLALKDAFISLGMELNACMDREDEWIEEVDGDVKSSLSKLMDTVRHIIDDEQTPEILKLLECDLSE